MLHQKIDVVIVILILMEEEIILPTTTLEKNAVTVCWISMSAFAWSKTFTVSVWPLADAL